MNKKLEVINGILSITDTETEKLEFRSLSAETFLNEFSGKFYFYYDLIIEDNVKRTRSIDYALSELVNSNNDGFSSDKALIEWVANNLGPGTGEGGTGGSSLSSYRSDYDAASMFIYAGYNIDGSPFINRIKDDIVEIAQSLTDLETDWTNRLTLTYI